MVTSLMLQESVAVMDASSFPTLTLKYAGCLGSARIIVSLLRIATTSAIVGRSFAFSCTHNNAMLMHRIISTEWLLGTKYASTRSAHLPSSHSCHAYKKFCHTCKFNVVENKKNDYEIFVCKLTYPMRLMKSPHWWLLEFRFPLRISRTRTPKLNTSDLIEKMPSEAYSGAM